MRDEGKDFNAAVWLLCAWTQTRGLLGLATGIHVVRELLEHFWPSMTPPPSRLRARRNRAAWMLEWLEAKLEDSFTPLTQEQLHSVLEDWDAIDAFWRAHDDDGPAFFRLRRRLAQLPVQASAEPAPEPIAPAPPHHGHQCAASGHACADGCTARPHLRIGHWRSPPEAAAAWPSTRHRGLGQ